jgi:hypothetical protein
MYNEILIKNHVLKEIGKKIIGPRRSIHTINGENFCFSCTGISIFLVVVVVIVRIFQYIHKLTHSLYIYFIIKPKTIEAAFQLQFLVSNAK